MAKVKNVIKGYDAKYGVENLHIIKVEENSVAYGGSADGWKNCIPDMLDFKKELENKEVINQIVHNFHTLYLFI